MLEVFVSSACTLPAKLFALPDKASTGAPRILVNGQVICRGSNRSGHRPLAVSTGEESVLSSLARAFVIHANSEAEQDDLHRIVRTLIHSKIETSKRGESW